MSVKAIGPAAPPPTGGIERARPGSTAVALVPPRRTAATPADIRGALERAHARVFGAPATPEVLDLLGAQVGIETADGRQMFNFNFGGIKGHGPSGKTAMCRTHEYVEGQKVTIRDGFRAYDSLDQGAADYLALMRDRFGGALTAARKGDVPGFARALKSAGYYTAPTPLYTDALRARVGHAGRTNSLGASREPASAGNEGEDLPLRRITDALAASEWAESAALRGRRATREENDED